MWLLTSTLLTTINLKVKAADVKHIYVLCAPIIDVLQECPQNNFYYFILTVALIRKTGFHVISCSNNSIDEQRYLCS